MTSTIGFIGLGNLGLPIATNLIRSGHKVTVYNRTKEKAVSLTELGARLLHHLPKRFAKRQSIQHADANSQFNSRPHA